MLAVITKAHGLLYTTTGEIAQIDSLAISSAAYKKYCYAGNYLANDIKIVGKKLYQLLHFSKLKVANPFHEKSIHKIINSHHLCQSLFFCG